MEKTVFATYPSLRDRVIVVTGGSTGIGEAIVEACAVQRARVAFLDIQDEEAERLIARLVTAGTTRPAYYHCDLTDIVALQRSVQQILDRFQTVDVLVNNAGNDTRHSIADVTSESWDQSIAVNLKHQFFMAQAVIPLKRIILPEEVARLVLFLAADDSSAITNQSYVIDGGWV